MENNICFIAIYVDDCALFGDQKLIKQTINKIQEEFMIKLLGSLHHYVGCNIMKNENSIIISQDSIIEDIEEEFDIPTERVHQTPATPNQILLRTENGEEQLNDNLHKVYRSSTGKLLYLTKHSRPDICNAVQELSQHIDRPNQAHLKAMY